jgi:hypothetical protein
MMKNLFLALAIAILGTTVYAGQGPAKAQAPAAVKPAEKAEAKAVPAKGTCDCNGTCDTMEVARRANFRERRSLFVVEQVPVTKTSLVPVVRPVRRVRGVVVGGVANCANCK